MAGRTGQVLWAVVASAVLVAGCSANAGTEGDESGDCSARIRFDDAVYRSLGSLRTPRAGDPLGTGEFLDCEGSTVTGLGKPAIKAGRDLDPTVAFLLAEKGYGDVLYVNETVAPADWPELVKAATRFPKCERPATFTGTWDYIEPEDNPNLENYDVAVPYTGAFTADQGEGLDFRTWSRVTLQAEFTSTTEPRPDAQFVERAVADDRPVAVTTECDGNAFEVTDIGFTG